MHIHYALWRKNNQHVLQQALLMHYRRAPIPTALYWTQESTVSLSRIIDPQAASIKDTRKAMLCCRTKKIKNFVLETVLVTQCLELSLYKLGIRTMGELEPSGVL